MCCILPSCCAVKQTYQSIKKKKKKKELYTTNTLLFSLDFTKIVKLIRHMSGGGLNLLARVVSTGAKNGLSFDKNSV